jgi:hypothetical protein
VQRRREHCNHAMHVETRALRTHLCLPCPRSSDRVVTRALVARVRGMDPCQRGLEHSASISAADTPTTTSSRFADVQRASCRVVLL